MGSLLAIILAINDLVAGTALLNGLWLHEIALSKDASTISWQI